MRAYPKGSVYDEHIYIYVCVYIYIHIYIYCHDGIGPKKTILKRSSGYNSITVVYMDAVGMTFIIS